jgi:hypothetical protein
MISVGRWHQLEVGYQRVRGHDVPIATRPETIVAASKAVDWNPDEALRLLGYDPDVVPDSQAQTQRRTRQRAKTLADATNADLIGELRRRMNSGHNSVKKQPP